MPSPSHKAHSTDSDKGPKAKGWGSVERESIHLIHITVPSDSQHSHLILYSNIDMIRSVRRQQKISDVRSDDLLEHVSRRIERRGKRSSEVRWRRRAGFVEQERCVRDS